MWNLLLAGVVGSIAYLALKDNKEESKKEEATTQTSKKKIVRKKISSKDETSLDLLYEIQKDGFEYAIVDYSDYKEMKDEKFNQLRQNFIKNAKAFEKYVELKNPIDSKYQEETSVILEKEGLIYGYLEKKPYHDWKDVKDAKFQKLLSSSRKSYAELESHLTKKFKIKDLNDDELYKAIDKLEGK